jgi:hypothetical protein
MHIYFSTDLLFSALQFNYFICRSFFYLGGFLVKRYGGLLHLQKIFQITILSRKFEYLSCSLFWAVNSNFLLRIMVWNIVLEKSDFINVMPHN